MPVPRRQIPILIVAPFLSSLPRYNGWNHDGRSDDDNLTRVMEVAERIAAEEKATPAPIPVLAIYVAWRGLSLYGFSVENLTFWCVSRLV